MNQSVLAGPDALASEVVHDLDDAFAQGFADGGDVLLGQDQRRRQDVEVAEGPDNQAALLTGPGDTAAGVNVIGQQLLGLAVGDAFDAHHEALAADVADEFEIAQVVESLLEDRTDLADMAADVLAFYDFQVL